MKEINKEGLKTLCLAEDVMFYLNAQTTENFLFEQKGPISYFFIEKDGEIQLRYFGVCRPRSAYASDVS